VGYTLCERTPNLYGKRLLPIWWGFFFYLHVYCHEKSYFGDTKNWGWTPVHNLCVVTDKLNTSLGLKQQWFTHWPKLLTNLTHHLALNSNDSLTDPRLLFKAKWCAKFVSNLGQWVNYCCLRPSDVPGIKFVRK
jgi:hypothetical protein